MQTNPAVEQSKKVIRWSKNPWNQSGGKGKGLWRKGFAEEPSLEFRIPVLFAAFELARVKLIKLAYDPTSAGLPARSTASAFVSMSAVLGMRPAVIQYHIVDMML